MKVLKDTDFQWHADQPDVPSRTAAQNKAFFDAPARVLMAKINEMIGESPEEIDSLARLSEGFAGLANDVMKNHGEFEDFRLMEYEKLKNSVDAEAETAQQLSEYVGYLKALELEKMRGVYVGSGEMPENCDVQIDPDGEPDTNIGHYVIDHLDLTIEEIRNIYDQCVVAGRPLVVKMGEAVNVCCHIYSNIALNSIAFLYMGLSSGKPCLSRHGYDMVTGSHTSSKYYLVKEG